MMRANCRGLSIASVLAIGLAAPVQESARAEADPATEVRELRRLEGHRGEAACVAITPDGKSILSGGKDSTLRVWDLATGKEVRQLPGHTGAVQALAISADGRRVLTGSADHTVRLWEIETGRELLRLQGHREVIETVALSPDGRRALSAGRDLTVRIWDVDEGTELRRFNGLAEQVRSLAFTPDSQLAVTAGGGLWKDGMWTRGTDHAMRLWDVRSGGELRGFKGHDAPVRSVALAPDGKSAATGGEDGTLLVWDLATGRQLRRIEMPVRAAVVGVAWSSDGKRLAAVTRGGKEVGGKLGFWDIATGKLHQKLASSPQGLTSLALSPDGKWAVTGGADGGVRVWELSR